jgi:uncharacterized protein
MHQIIGREAEIKVLQSTLDSDKSEFIAVTGRRRVGKTFLIHSYFKQNLCFYLTGIQKQPIKAQLQAFADELSRRKGGKVSAPADWMEAFSILRDYVELLDPKRKKVIFIDELAWVDTQRSGFLQIFAHFWNSWAAWERNIILVVAGSSTSWIVNKVYNDTGGLHNRVTKRIWLTPFTLAETKTFFKSKQITLSNYEIALIYMVFGGVPFYLNEVQPGESAAQAIQRLCFDDGGMLKTEFDNLYASIFRDPEPHMRVAKALAKHTYGLTKNDLLKEAQLTNSGATNKVIDELVATGYLVHMIPFGNQSRNAKYILADFYSRFYLFFLAQRRATDWMTIIETPTFRAWSGMAFEWLCHSHRAEILKALGINGIRTQTSYLHIMDPATGKITAQIDLLIDRADNAINLCEIKFASDVYKMQVQDAEQMQNKLSKLKDQLKKRKSIFPVMITPFGCEKNAHFLGLVHHQVVLDQLFGE